MAYDFSLTEEQELLLETLKAVMDRGNYEEYFRECDRNRRYPERAAKDMLEAGFGTLGIPEEYGGTPCDTMTMLLIYEEVHALGWPALTWINQALSVHDMMEFGTKEQQEIVMKLALEGKKPFTLGFSEPQAGSDSAAITTSAARKDGKIYINGHKVFNTGGNVAPYMLCIARDYENENPYKDCSLYFIPMNKPGITVKPMEKVGLHMMATCEVYLDNVEIEEKDLCGIKGNGFAHLMLNYDIERLFTCACNVGMARCAYQDALRYANQRMQFGKTIGSFQIIQEKITDMAIKIENMQNMIRHAAWKYTNGERISVDAALAKRYTGKAAFEVIDDAMQIMGGIGYTESCRISRLWRDQRVYRIFAGSEEIMVHNAGRAILKADAKKM